MALEIRQFGRFEVWKDDVLIPSSAWKRHKTRQLLQLLLLERGSVVQTDRLVECLFPGGNPERSSISLRARISDLRGVLEPNLIKGSDSLYVHTEREGYSFTGEAVCWLDTEAFQRLVKLSEELEKGALWSDAAARAQSAHLLYRGEFLAADPYEDWSTKAREHYRNSWISLLKRQGRCHAIAGRMENAVKYFTEAAQVQPHDESACRQLMTCLYCMGEAGMAVEAFGRCEAALAELGAIPSPETQKLLDDVRQGSMSRSVPHAAMKETPSRPVQLESVEPVRRRVSVLACCLRANSEDSKSISEAVPQRAASEWHEYSSSLAERYGGSVLYRSNSLWLVRFGNSAAREDDPIRASQLAHELRNALERINAKLLQVEGIGTEICMGIATGLETASWRALEDAAEETEDDGTTARATMMAHEAASGTILLDPETYGQSKVLFHTEEVASELAVLKKGSSLYRLVAPRSVSSRFEGAVASGLTPFVGRSSELDALLASWKRATERAGQAVAVRGVAGVGKSRLIYEFGKRLAGESVTILSCEGSALQQGTEYAPLLPLLRNILGIESYDGSDRQRLMLSSRLLRTVYPPERSAPLLEKLLGIRDPAAGDSSAFSPERQRMLTMEVLIGLTLGMSEAAPLLFIAENLHWMDPSTLEFIQHLVAQAPTCRALILCTYRPEQYLPPWMDKAHVATLSELPLSEPESKELVELLSQGRLEPSVVSKICARTDGIPLFIEEVAQAVLSRDGALDKAESTALAREIEIPDSLRGLLAARVDQLRANDPITQLAATIGREFEHDLILELSDSPKSEVQDVLDRHTQSGLLLKRGFAPRALYRFRHELLREAVAETADHSRRQDMHRSIAVKLSGDGAGSTLATPEMIARHFAAAGEHALAATYWQIAGRQAATLSANEEALGFFAQAIRCVRSLPGNEAGSVDELELLLEECSPAIAHRGYAAPRLRALLERAWHLVEILPGSPRLAMTLFLLSSHHMATGEHKRSRKLALQAHRNCRKLDDVQLMARANFGRGVTSFFAGDLQAASSALDCARSTYVPRAHESALPFYGQDFAVLIRGYGGFTSTLIGDLETGQQLVTEALNLAHKGNHAFSTALAYVFDGWKCLLREEVDALESSARKLLGHASTYDLALPISTARHFLAWCDLRRGEAQRAIQTLMEVRLMWQAIGVRFYSSALLTWLAEGQLQLGDPYSALETIDEAVAYSEQSGELFYRPELHRVRHSVILAIGNNSDEDKRELALAKRWAEQQRAHLFSKRYMERYN